jgi:hypothetical protein
MPKSYRPNAEASSAQLPCADKLAFDTRDQAAVSVNVTQYQRGLTVRPYRCRHCGLWHLTSQAPDPE